MDGVEHSCGTSAELLSLQENARVAGRILKLWVISPVPMTHKVSSMERNIHSILRNFNNFHFLAEFCRHANTSLIVQLPAQLLIVTTTCKDHIREPYRRLIGGSPENEVDKSEGYVPQVLKSAGNKYDPATYTLPPPTYVQRNVPIDLCFAGRSISMSPSRLRLIY